MKGTSNGLLTMASHFGAYKLHYSRGEINWEIPLSYIFIIMFEQMFQNRDGKMITLMDREKIDNGEYDKKLKTMREMRKQHQ